MEKKSETPVVTAFSFVKDLLEDMFPDSITIFTDRSVDPKYGTTAATRYISALGTNWVGRLNIRTSSTTAEMCASWWSSTFC